MCGSFYFIKELLLCSVIKWFKDTYFKPLDSIVLSVMSGLGDLVEDVLVSREVSLDTLSTDSDITLSVGLGHLLL